MNHKEFKLLTDICDLATLFSMILRCESSKWLESSIKSGLGLQFAIWNLDLALWDFAFFKHSFLCKNRLLKRVSCLFS